MWDSVGLVHESLSAALCGNRKDEDRNRFMADRSSRQHSRRRNPLSGAPHSVQAGLPNSPFRIPNCTAFRPRSLQTDYKVGNAPFARLSDNHGTVCAAAIGTVVRPVCPTGTVDSKTTDTI